MPLTRKYFPQSGTLIGFHFEQQPPPQDEHQSYPIFEKQLLNFTWLKIRRKKFCLTLHFVGKIVKT